MEKSVTVRSYQMRREYTKKKVIVFSLLAAAVIVVAMFGEYLCPYDPYAQQYGAALQPPSGAHWLGTDRYGRDMLSRIIVGAQISIFLP